MGWGTDLFDTVFRSYIEAVVLANDIEHCVDASLFLYS